MNSMANGTASINRLVSAGLGAVTSLAALTVLGALVDRLAGLSPALDASVFLVVGPDPSVLRPVVLGGLVLLSAILAVALEPVARESTRRAVFLAVAFLVAADVVWVFVITLAATLPGGPSFLPVEAALIAFGGAVPVIGVLGSPFVALWALAAKKLGR